jgi:hypothetical protein
MLFSTLLFFEKIKKKGMGVDFYDLSTTGGEISSQRQVIIIPPFFFLFFFFGSLFRSYEIILECRDCTSSLFFSYSESKKKKVSALNLKLHALFPLFEFDFYFYVQRRNYRVPKNGEKMVGGIKKESH